MEGLIFVKIPLIN